ncbi:uncharacterized protein LOC143533852 [Bidens hawaiensis]|uniref:uncharacterized protein LOC143533852 n=1 Tax=Bidens hawaiensis TaxID=980011 RepID=UPI00404AE073
MSTTPGPDIVSLCSEPERHLREGLRRRAREISEVIENEVVEDDANPEVEEMADPNNQGRMDDFATPSLDGYGSGVTEPEITVSFEIKSSIIHMVENSISFHGLSNEDPHSHVAHFLRLCATFKIQGCTDDAYFLPDKTARYRAKITGFRVDDDESLHAMGEVQGLVEKIPSSQFESRLQCCTFFDALSGAQKQAVDQLEALTKRFDQMQSDLAISSSRCGVCDGKHQTSQCQQAMVVEDVDFVGRQNNAYNNSYNLGWRNHPNFSWKDNGGSQNQSQNQKPPGSGQSSGGSSVENLLTQLLAKTETSNKLAEQRNLKIDETLQRHDLELRNQKASIQTIENQAKAITLRSGRSTIPVDASVSTPKPIADEIETETPGEVQPRLIPESTAQTSEPVRTYVPPIPYPGRLKKQKMEEQYGKFLELFEQVHINLPFLDALKEMPKYAKFLKEVLSNKKKLEELSCVTLNEECSAVLYNKLPKK